MIMMWIKRTFLFRVLEKETDVRQVSRQEGQVRHRIAPCVHTGPEPPLHGGRQGS